MRNSFDGLMWNLQDAFKYRCFPSLWKHFSANLRSTTTTSSHDRANCELLQTPQDDWPRQRRQGSRKGWSQTPQEGPPGQHPGHHQACHPPSGPPWRCQAHLWPHLRGDPRCPEGVPGERHPRCSHLHWARQEEDCHCHGRCLRSEEARKDPVRVRRVIIELGFSTFCLSMWRDSLRYKRNKWKSLCLSMNLLNVECEPLFEQFIQW